jgi:hypothetical protein
MKGKKKKKKEKSKGKRKEEKGKKEKGRGKREKERGKGKEKKGGQQHFQVPNQENPPKLEENNKPQPHHSHLGEVLLLAERRFETRQALSLGARDF